MPSVDYKRNTSILVASLAKDLAEICLERITHEFDIMTSGGYTHLSQEDSISVVRLNEQAEDNNVDASANYDSLDLPSDNSPHM